MLHLLLALPPSSSPLPPPSHPPLTVLITGATGRTGSLLYLSLSPLPHLTVRALVSNRTKASAVLGCGACLPSDGVWEGDVTSPSSLIAPMAGVDVVAIAVGVRGGPMQSSQMARLVEFVGVQNQVAALMAGGGGRGRRAKRVVLCSSMGTTDPKGAVGGGDVLFYKLNAEAFLGASGIGARSNRGLVGRGGRGGACVLAGQAAWEGESEWAREAGSD